MNIFLRTIGFLCCSSLSFAQKSYGDRIDSMRVSHQKEFSEQVLNEEERLHFSGICYFAVDTNYRVTATFKKDIGKKFKMPMSKERTVYYRKYGTVSFRIGDSICVLNVYQNRSLKGKKAFKNYLFLPFKDGSTGIQTYGAGRYMDVYLGKSDTLIIDFNEAYHPYCAYSDRYSCPIVPTENKISLAILAGECYVSHH